MEPVTHILTGACLARAGCNRRAAYATLAMAVAAELPDIDTLWSFDGPVAGFQHHRGITHTLVGIPVEAALTVVVVYGIHRWRMRRRQRQPSSKPLTAVPARWGLLFWFCLLALASHLFLDWTNNYGVRVLFPFDRHWHAGSFVFIFDPWLFALLLLPVLLPPLFGLVGREVGARQPAFRGRGWAVATLVLICVYWSFRATQHAHAVDAAESAAVREAAPADPNAPPPAPDADGVAVADAPQPYQAPQQVEVSPDMLNPFRWHAALGFASTIRLAEIDSRSGTLDWTQQVFTRPQPTPAVLSAYTSSLGRVYLDWSPMPIVLQDPVTPAAAAAEGLPLGTTQVVRFSDPRFRDSSPLSSASDPPLTGTVDLDAANHVLRTTFDGRTQR